MVVIFHEVITVSIFLAQQITTKIDLRCFEKLGPEEDAYVVFERRYRCQVLLKQILLVDFQIYVLLRILIK